MPVYTKEMERNQRELAKMEKRKQQMKVYKARKLAEAKDGEERKEVEKHLAENEDQILREIDAQEKEAEERDAAEQEQNKQSREEAKIREEAERRETMKRESAALVENVGAQPINTEELLSKKGFTIIRQELAKGAFSRIYKAKSQASDADLAVKVTPLEPKTSHHVKRYIISYPVLRYLILHQEQAVNIVRLIELFSTPQKTYLFMELLETSNLQVKLRKQGAVPEDQALLWAQGIGRGIAYLHSIGAAHENLKPDSVLFDAAGNVKLGGLGWTCVYYDSSTDSILKQPAMPGKHHHFSPEKGKGPYDPSKADVWSFGTLIVVLLTKEWPFDFKSRHSLDIQWKLCLKKRSIKPSDECFELLTSLFQVDPEARPFVPEIMSQGWLAKGGDDASG